jgi:hypothetical protein
MVRTSSRYAAVVLLVLGAIGLWEAAGTAAAENPYPVPDGGVPELIALIQKVSQVRPETPQDDIQHRLYARPALRQAAEKILELESDPKTQAHQAARFLVMVERIRSIAQCDPDPRQTTADVRAYVAELVEAGQETVAADLALLLGQTLVHAGQWQCAVDAYKSISPLFADTKNQRISTQMRTIEANAQRVLATIEKIDAGGKKATIRPTGQLVPLDLSEKWNRKLVDFSGSGLFEGNGLAELTQGERVLRGVTFRIGEGVVQLGSTRAPDQAAEASDIAVRRKISRLYVLHATQWGLVAPPVQDGTTVGQYRLRYQDGTTASLPIVFGEDVRDWWTSDGGIPLARGVVAWTGANLHTEPRGIALRLCLSVWDNPHPEKQVAAVDFVSSMDTQAAPFCVALTVEDAETQ